MIFSWHTRCVNWNLCNTKYYFDIGKVQSQMLQYQPSFVIYTFKNICHYSSELLTSLMATGLYIISNTYTYI